MTREKERRDREKKEKAERKRGKRGREKREKKHLSCFIFVLVSAALVLNGFAQEKIPETNKQSADAEIIQLPDPRYESETSVEKALSLRRSVRTFADEPLSISEISQILWAAQGFTEKRDKLPSRWNPKYEWQGGLRTAPSAGALYPMELYLVAGNVQGLSNGVYKYIPKNHSLKKILDGDKRTEIAEAALKQDSINEGAALIVMAGVYERTSFKYGERAERYVYMEVGFIGENIYLQGMALGIGTVMIGAFKDEELKKVLDLPEEENPLAIMPLGKIRKK
ncbi:MAG: SagB/ThcOx family dehydrogenase [Candidatus Aminicenantales bacterium]